MPRIPPLPLLHLLLTHKSPHLPLLLRETRSLAQAANELRWMREKVEREVPLPLVPPPPVVLPPGASTTTSTAAAEQEEEEEEEENLQLGLYWAKLTRLRRKRLLDAYVARRAVWSEPLQYILGCEYFGGVDLEVKVRRGVLVPRPETADLVQHLFALLGENPGSGWRGGGSGLHVTQNQNQNQKQRQRQRQRQLNVLDVCSGSGCIPLLVHSLVCPPTTTTNTNTNTNTNMNMNTRIKVLGIDISPPLIPLSRKNLLRNVRSGKIHESAVVEGEVGFLRGDVFGLVPRSGGGGTESSELLEKIKRFYSDNDIDGPITIDILISNPPYITPHAYLTSTTRSVRKWEPKIALVPPPPASPTTTTTSTSPTIRRGDEFYPHLSALAHTLFNTRILLVEVGGDEGQAQRVKRIFEERFYLANDQEI
ncbi:hypothetical protein DFH27DRAFT_600334 [Peziza echinospora]|nr:hypothetical protein DFH27DRAFT_600334 [Peziza echinospora]